MPTSCDELFQYDPSFPSGIYSIAMTSQSGEIGNTALYCKNFGTVAVSYVSLPKGAGTNYAHWNHVFAAAEYPCQPTVRNWTEAGKTFYSKVRLNLTVSQKEYQVSMYRSITGFHQVIQHYY